jgi:hypothetical protein
MTEFRTKGKGKDRQVYPIKKRQPFGVTRKLAYEDVLALRKEGKRARLIKTNKKLDLYAPYEAVGPDSPQENTENNPEPVNSQKDASSGPLTINEVEKVKSTMAPLITRHFSPLSIYSKDGKTYAVSIDDAHIMMLYATLNGQVSGEENPVGQKIRIPALSYEDSNSAQFTLGKDQQMDLLRELREHKDATDVVIHKPEGSHDTYLFLRGEDRETGSLIILGDPIRLPIQNPNRETITTHLPPDYIKRSLNDLRKISRENKFSGSLFVRARSDYPIEMSAGNGDVQYTSLVAPRMSEREWEIIRKLNETIKGVN